MDEASGSLPPDTNNAPTYLIVSGIFGLIALLLCCARVITKQRSSTLIAADYTIAIGEVLSIAGYCCSIGAAANGWGHLSAYVPPDNKVVALKCLFALQLFWILTILVVRVSIALSLLRLSDNTWWKWSLWFLIVVQTLLSSGWLVVQFAWCRPLRSKWEPVADMKCWDFQYQINFGWVTSGIFVAMDLIFAIMPIKLIYRLRRSLRERILITCLMALGLIATSMAGVKMTTFKEVGKVDLLSTTYASLLAKMEEVFGIIAACAPTLKAPAERLLRRIGVVSAHEDLLSTPSFVNSKAANTDRHIRLAQVNKAHEDDYDDNSRDGEQEPDDSCSIKCNQSRNPNSSTTRNRHMNDCNSGLRPGSSSWLATSTDGSSSNTPPTGGNQDASILAQEGGKKSWEVV